MELGLADVSLLERCPPFRGCLLTVFIHLLSLSLSLSGADICSVCTEAGMFAIRARRKVCRNSYTTTPSIIIYKHLTFSLSIFINGIGVSIGGTLMQFSEQIVFGVHPMRVCVWVGGGWHVTTGVTWED